MNKIVEIGTVSACGQGERVFFVVEGDTIIIKKVDTQKTWEEVTRPLREAAKNIREKDVVDLVHQFRKAKRQ